MSAKNTPSSNTSLADQGKFCTICQRYHSAIHPKQKWYQSVAKYCLVSFALVLGSIPTVIPSLSDLEKAFARITIPLGIVVIGRVSWQWLRPLILKPAAYKQKWYTDFDYYVSFLLAWEVKNLFTFSTLLDIQRTLAQYAIMLILFLVMAIAIAVGQRFWNTRHLD